MELVTAARWSVRSWLMLLHSSVWRLGRENLMKEARERNRDGMGDLMTEPGAGVTLSREDAGSAPSAVARGV